jgi:colicin import membrane protein
MHRRLMLAGLMALLVAPAPALVARRKSQSSAPRRSRRARSAAYGGGGDKNASYPNCSAARAAGAAPLHVGDGGYSRRLDRDGDGIACE